MKCPDDICSLASYTQKRWAFCVRENPSSEMRWQRVMDDFCSGQPKPQLERPCDTSMCTQAGYWKTGSFTTVCLITHDYKMYSQVHKILSWVRLYSLMWVAAQKNKTSLIIEINSEREKNLIQNICPVWNLFSLAVLQIVWCWYTEEESDLSASQSAE